MPFHRHFPSLVAPACLAALFALAAAARPASAQSADTGFAPTPNRTVNAIGVQADGRVLVGGRFTTIDGTTRNGIARLNADGSLDAGFDPDAGGITNHNVHRILAQPDGKILVGGDFSGMGASQSHLVARLDADGSVDPGFVPDVETIGGDNIVYGMAVQADGKVLLGGRLTALFDTPFGPQSGPMGVVRLNADGSRDESYRPRVTSDTFIDGDIRAMAMQADGKLVIAGTFGNVDEQPRKGLARLNADGSLDDSFKVDIDGGWIDEMVAQPDDRIVLGGRFLYVGDVRRNNLARLNADGSVDAGFDPFPDDEVFGIAVQPDGRVLVGGSFTHVGGQARGNLARLEAGGGIDASFDPGVDGRVGPVAVQPDGQIVIGGGILALPDGGFTAVGGQPRSGLARLHADGAVDAGFANAGANGHVYAMAAQADGKTIVGGAFTTIGAQPRRGTARLNADGSVDAGFRDPGVIGTVYAAAVQPDGKLLIGGNFTQVGTQARSYLARLDADGIVDADFVDADVHGAVHALAVQADGKVLIGGEFTAVGVQPRGYLARLNADGSLDEGFVDPAANEKVLVLVAQADGRLVAGGRFTQIGGQARHYLARLDANGRLDADFADIDANDQVSALAVQADGKLVIGGNFSEIGTQARNHVARVDADGHLDDGFGDPGFSSTVSALAVQADGRILVGGWFTSVGSASRRALARLDTDGRLDPAFADVGVNGGWIHALALQAEGRLLVAGNITAIGAQPARFVGRIVLPEAAAQSLDLDGAAATWRRAGAAPEFDAPPLLYVCADGDGCTALGAMTRVADGWRRGNVALPSGASRLRAVGRTGGGYRGASQGLVDSVRRVWRDDRIFADGFD